MRSDFRYRARVRSFSRRNRIAARGGRPSPPSRGAEYGLLAPRGGPALAPHQTRVFLSRRLRHGAHRRETPEGAVSRVHRRPTGEASRHCGSVQRRGASMDESARDRARGHSGDGARVARKSEEALEPRARENCPQARGYRFGRIRDLDDIDARGASVSVARHVRAGRARERRGAREMASARAGLGGVS